MLFLSDARQTLGTSTNECDRDYDDVPMQLVHARSTGLEGCSYNERRRDRVLP